MKISDLSKLQEVWEKYHKDSFDLPEYTIGAVRIGHNFGLIANFLEAIVVFDLSYSKRARVQILKKMLLSMEEFANQKGIKQVHIFAQDPEFAGILKKHFGFQTCTGEALVKNIGI